MNDIEDLYSISYKPNVNLWKPIDDSSIQEYLNDAFAFRDFVLSIDTQLQCMKHRVKSVESIKNKVERLRETEPPFIIFNDILAYKYIHDDVNCFDDICAFSYVMKTNGYRAKHYYFRPTSEFYPIEVQVATKHDSKFNNWNRKYIYKQYIKIGEYLRDMYEDGLIKTEDEFLCQLKKLEKEYPCAKIIVT